MEPSFESDLAEAIAQIETARVQLMTTLSTLGDEDLNRARRGGWTVRRVLEHIVDGEGGYAGRVRRLQGKAGASSEPTDFSVASPADVMRALEGSRKLLLSALEGVAEDSFYRLERYGREEYSILSVLENIAHHDREHAEQIRAILDRSR